MCLEVGWATVDPVERPGIIRLTPRRRDPGWLVLAL
jgi:hypothetical protein